MFLLLSRLIHLHRHLLLRLRGSRIPCHNRTLTDDRGDRSFDTGNSSSYSCSSDICISPAETVET